MIQVTESGYYYGYYTMKDAKTITATTGNRMRTFSKCDHVYLLDLGYCEAGEDITLTSADTDQILVQGYRLMMQHFRQHIIHYPSRPWS